MAECFLEKSRWRWNEQVCLGVKCEESAALAMFRKRRPKRTVIYTFGRFFVSIIESSEVECPVRFSADMLASHKQANQVKSQVSEVQAQVKYQVVSLNPKSSSKSSGFTNQHNCCGLFAVILSDKFMRILPGTTLTNDNRYLIIMYSVQPVTTTWSRFGNISNHQTCWPHNGK